MKKISLFLLAMSLITCAMAQDKSATPVKQPAKPTYQLNGSKPVTVTLTFTIPIGYLDSYIYVEGQGGPLAIESSDKLTGAQIKGLKQVDQAVRDSVNNHLYKRYQDFIKADQDKFTADTLAKYHPAPAKTK